MLAVIDETAPFVAAGVCYGVVSCVLLSGEADARSLVRPVIPPGRRRPFHWYREGIVAQQAMLEAAQKIGVVGRAVVVPCGRRRQEAARRVALTATVEHLLRDGCTHLVIESRTPEQDVRDRGLMIELLRYHEAENDLTYSWTTKTEPL